MASRTHNYTRQIPGKNYAIEPVDWGRFQITAYGLGVRPNDYLLLQEGNNVVKYRVEAIDYYCDTPMLWTALLVKCC